MTKTLTSVQPVEEKNIGVIPTALLHPKMGKCSRTRAGLFPEDESQGVSSSLGKLPSLIKTPFSQAGGGSCTGIACPERT